MAAQPARFPRRPVGGARCQPRPSWSRVGATAALLPGKGCPAQLGTWLSSVRTSLWGGVRAGSVLRRVDFLRVVHRPCRNTEPTWLGPSYRGSKPSSESETEDSARPPSTGHPLEATLLSVCEA